MQCILKFIVGITLFLFGINILTSSLKNIKKDWFNILLKGTNNKYKGILIGTIVTAILQSSSFVTVLLVSLVDSQIMTLNNTVGIILGSNIGTCITAWIFSLANLSDYASIFSLDTLVGILAVFCIILLIKKKIKIANLSFGLIILILGMNMMSNSLIPFTTTNGFISFLNYLTNPLFGLLLGIIITGIFQSSSLFIGIVESLAINGNINFLLGFTLILGSNIGTCVTTLISSANTNKTSKKVSMFHLVFNILGTLIFLIGFYLLNYFFHFSFTYLPINAFHIALIHTLFNVLSTIILLPFTNKMIKLCDYLVR